MSSQPMNTARTYWRPQQPWRTSNGERGQESSPVTTSQAYRRRLTSETRERHWAACLKYCFRPWTVALLLGWLTKYNICFKNIRNNNWIKGLQIIFLAERNNKRCVRPLWPQALPSGTSPVQHHLYCFLTKLAAGMLSNSGTFGIQLIQRSFST